MRRVYVGGTYGQTPTVVATSIERAMRRTVDLHRVPGDIEKHGFPEQWTCAFIDADDVLRCTTTITEEHGETYTLYVEQFDVEDDDADV